MIEGHISAIERLIEQTQEISFHYNKHNNKFPFNIILSTSDFYFRENFHSDILAAILKQDNFFIRFIEWLNILPGKRIELNFYCSTLVIREDGKIDILIKDKLTNHCIIIENKINDAGDMDRQIPRYLEKQRNEGFIIDAIIYLSLDGSKRPDRSSWTEDDKIKIEKENVIYCGAINKTDKTNMVDGFLNKCIINDCGMAEYSYLKQYIDLIEYMGRMKIWIKILWNNFIKKSWKGKTMKIR